MINSPASLQWMRVPQDNNSQHKYVLHDISIYGSDVRSGEPCEYMLRDSISSINSKFIGITQWLQKIFKSFIKYADWSTQEKMKLLIKKVNDQRLYYANYLKIGPVIGRSSRSDQSHTAHTDTSDNLDDLLDMFNSVNLQDDTESSSNGNKAKITGTKLV
jgi:hypothetical protein